jgi:hypothetical protein
MDRVENRVLRIMRALFDKPLQESKERYYEKHKKEMPRKKYEEERLRLFLVYGCLFFLILFVLDFVIKAVFL